MDTRTIDGVALVRFDLPAVAQQMHVGTEALANAMLEATARALLRDAWQLLEMTMQERGLRPGIDEFPDDWPTNYLAVVARERMFPDLQDTGQPDHGTASH
ncbi:MAG TPA: hypothetical protein VGH74_07675 [Planctomycetaceae bacterium]|jgi:hypothetical protein